MASSSFAAGAESDEVAIVRELVNLFWTCVWFDVTFSLSELPCAPQSWERLKIARSVAGELRSCPQICSRSIFLRTCQAGSAIFCRDCRCQTSCFFLWEDGLRLNKCSAAGRTRKRNATRQKRNLSFQYRSRTKQWKSNNREFQRLFGRLLVRFFFQVGHL